MFYRRKVLITLISEFGGKISRTQLQKLLFLVSRHQESPSYDFVPYHFGCYSFQATADLKALAKYGYLDKDSGNWVLRKTDLVEKELKRKDLAHIKHVVRSNASKSVNEIIRETYLNYPYYASRSKILSQVLSKDEIPKVLKQRISKKERVLFTIGYEGRSLEKYLNKLLLNDVKILCDVRKNPLSRKFGFSKNQLSYACNALGIIYFHIPELGIESVKRKSLTTHKDYLKLFDEYEKSTLKEQDLALSKIISLINDNRRVALTCFEESHHMCHRGRIAKHLENTDEWDYGLIHL